MSNRRFQFIGYALILFSIVTKPVRAYEVDADELKEKEAAVIISERVASTADAMAKPKKKIPSIISAWFLKPLADASEALEYILEYLPEGLSESDFDSTAAMVTAVGGGAVMLGGGWKALYAIVTLPGHAGVDTYQVLRARRIHILTENARRELREAIQVLNGLGREYAPHAKALTEHISSVPYMPHWDEVHGKSPVEIDRLLSDPQARKRIENDPKGSEWLKSYDEFRTVDKSHVENIEAVAKKALEQTSAASQKANKAANHGLFLGFLRDKSLSHVKLDYTVAHAENKNAGVFDTHWDGAPERRVEDLSRLGDVLLSPHQKCDDLLTKVVLARHDHGHRGFKRGIVGPVGWPLVVLAGYGVYTAGKYFGKTTKGGVAQPLQLYRNQQAQEQVDRTSAEWTTQRPTTIAAALKKARTGPEADPELVEIYSALRKNFRLVLKDIATGFEKKTSPSARRESNFDVKLAIIEEDNARGNEELNDIIDLSLAEGAIEIKTVKVGEITETLLSGKKTYESVLFKLVKETYLGTIRNAWPLLKLSDSSYPVESETIGAAVNATIPEFRKINVGRLNRMEKEARKMGIKTAPAAGATPAEAPSAAKDPEKGHHPDEKTSSVKIPENEMLLGSMSTSPGHNRDETLSELTAPRR